MPVFERLAVEILSILNGKLQTQVETILLVDPLSKDHIVTLHGHAHVDEQAIFTLGRIGQLRQLLNARLGRNRAAHRDYFVLVAGRVFERRGRIVQAKFFVCIQTFAQVACRVEIVKDILRKKLSTLDYAVVAVDVILTRSGTFAQILFIRQFVIVYFVVIIVVTADRIEA